MAFVEDSNPHVSQLARDIARQHLHGLFGARGENDSQQIQNSKETNPWGNNTQNYNQRGRMLLDTLAKSEQDQKHYDSETVNRSREDICNVSATSALALDLLEQSYVPPPQLGESSNYNEQMHATQARIEAEEKNLQRIREASKMVEEAVKKEKKYNSNVYRSLSIMPPPLVSTSTKDVQRLLEQEKRALEETRRALRHRQGHRATAESFLETFKADTKPTVYKSQTDLINAIEEKKKLIATLKQKRKHGGSYRV
eukprot:m.99701 g.99701  ORF g.99701 m.99701 type:complete len:255 (+) comp13678_c0_seq3:118-882(+)